MRAKYVLQEVLIGLWRNVTMTIAMMITMTVSLSMLGESEKARDWNRRALAMDPDDPSVLYNIACAFSMEGQLTEAFGALQKAIDHGFGHWKWIENDADLDPMREDSRFVDLLARKPANTQAEQNA